MIEVDLRELMPKAVRGAQMRLVHLPVPLYLGENPVSSTLLAPGTANATQKKLARMKNSQDVRAIRRAKVLYDAWLSFYRGNIAAAQEEAIHLFEDIAENETVLSAKRGPVDKPSAGSPAVPVEAPSAMEAAASFDDPPEAPALFQKLGAAYLICCLARYGMKRYYIDSAVAYMRRLKEGPSRSAQAASIDLAMYEMSIGIMSDVPAWVKEADFGVGRVGSKLLFGEGSVHPDNLYAAVLAAVQYKNYQGEYLKSLMLVDVAEKVLGMQSVVVGDAYFALYRALNQEALGYSDEADAELQRAVELVRRDGLWQIMGEFSGGFGGRLLSIVEEADGEGAAICRRISEGFFERVIQSHEDEKGRRGHKVLTAQELAVMRLVAAGLKNAEIAEELHIGAETVKFHKRNASQKLGTRPRATTAEIKEALDRNQISAEWVS